MLARSCSVIRFGLLVSSLCCFAPAAPAAAQAIKPWFLIILDTSGSMCENDVNVANSCGFTPTIKMNAAKCAIQQTLAQTGDAEFGLGQFSQNMNCSGGTSNDTSAAGLMRIAISPTGAASILPLVDGVGAPSGNCNADGTSIVNGDNTQEMCSGGGTPTSGTLRMVQDYFQGNLAGFTAPTEVNSQAIGCRPMNVILLTDGMSNGGGTPSDRAAELLNNMRVPTSAPQTCPGDASCTPVRIRTYPIGFGIASGNAEIESIATQGGTDNSLDGPGGLRGYYAGQEDELSEAFAQIIFDSQLNEVCNGVDDDCDGRVDEGSAAYCDADGIRSANPLVPDPTTGLSVDQETTVSVTGVQSNIDTLTCSIAGSMCVGMTGNALITCCANTMSCCDVVSGDLDGTPSDLAICAAPDYAQKDMCSPHNRLCASPGEICDGEDNDCDGETDEGPLVGTVPAEVCNNGNDDDCDGDTDEDCAGCVPETCDNADNDCDGLVDEDLVRSCGFDLGAGFPDSICEAGQQTCVRGQWGAVCPGATLNGSTCTVTIPDSQRDIGDPFPTGWHGSASGLGFGTCVFEQTETCDDLDNDCNTLVDDLPATACTSGTIPLGSLPRGICRAGSSFCDPVEADKLGPCLFEVLPTTEICNTLDDDCDGFTDEAPGVNPTHTPITRACGTDAGICARGTETCNSSTGVFGACTGATTGTTEVCNAVSGAPDQTLYDEDCDTRTDESDPAIPGACVPNGTGAPAPGPLPGNANTGECQAGTVQCVSGALRCSNYTGPGAELCDNLDQDCNGNNTNGVGPTTGNPNGAAGTDPSLGTPCFPPSYAGFPDAIAGLGACTPGRLVCDTATETTQCAVFGTPSAEICDGIDNDCDAEVDEDVYDASDTCQSTPPNNPVRSFCGECVSAAGEVVVCRESLVDDVVGMGCTSLGYGAPINHGGVSDCCGAYAFTSSWNLGNLVGPHNGAGECSLGVLKCINGDPVCDGEVTPIDELCDGNDNDCDGDIDEVIPTEGQPCGDDTGECELGRLECTGSTGFMCIGGDDGDDELCDGKDNDCDGFYDEENPGGGADCGGNVENCMRRVDPSNTSQPETVPCGRCERGVEVCVTLFDGNDLPVDGEIQCLGAVGPRPEVCDGRDNDCDSKCRIDAAGVATCPPDIPDADDKIDEGVATTDPNVGSACGEEEGECTAGSYVCDNGDLVCEGGTGPMNEICDGLDNDCDGIDDDGVSSGAPCGSSMGECRPGNFICDPNGSGDLICDGAIGPMDEICDGLDNDCDGDVDDGLGVGDECGSDEGECMKGHIECVGGRDKCIGAQVPGFEVCDCKDNDCDGKTDEDTSGEPICGATAECVMCQCALPCTEATEFGTQCPQGKAPVNNDDGCFCVGALCNDSTCADETIMDSDDKVLCAPDSTDVGTCACKNNACTERCAGVVCDGGLVCDKTDGSCKEATCLLAQFACDDTQRCSRVDGVFQCVEDQCATKECAADEACRHGECFKSCARVECEATELCIDGECVTNQCASVSCGQGKTCDPDNGDCVDTGECVRTGCTNGEICDRVEGNCSENPCLATHCPFGEQCDLVTGQCELRCAENLLFCEDGCANPQNSREHCGATGDCLGDNAGEQCAQGLVCSRGECSETCDDGLVNCGGACVDTQVDALHCGATGDCMGDNAGRVCQTGSSCVAGRCMVNNAGGAGGEGGAAGFVDGKRVIASGGGGCACSVPGSTKDTSTSRRGALALGLFGFGIALLGMRRARTRVRVASARAGKVVLTASQGALLLALLTLPAETGCSVDTFCLNCDDPNGPNGPDQDSGVGGQGVASGGVGGVTGGSGGVGGDGGPGGSGGSGGDGGPPTPDGGCVSTELCNGIDDDCDDSVDEDADPAAVGIDVATDPLHCGGCGRACSLEHAFNKCEDSTCKIDRDQGQAGCDVGYFDFDGEEDNGCEYRCIKTADDDSDCDLIDNDCDKEIDEDVDFSTDPMNCGSCGQTCRFPHATLGSTCVAEDCVLDNTKCDDGFKDVNGSATDGCERRCPVFPTTDEVCNLQDDDCDGTGDESADVVAFDPLVGVTCGTNTGLCSTGTSMCVAGEIVCTDVKPTTEVCDGDDNDCDGNTDESDPTLTTHPACGSAIGACERGVLVCSGGDIVCGGATFVGPAAVETCNRIDDDCDGLIDEEAVVNDGGTLRELADNIACSTRGGSLDITPSTPAVGECEYGRLACSAGQLVCRDEVLPAAELCDNEDTDCDGDPVPADLDDLEDPRLGTVCSNQLGICAGGTPGTTECVNNGTVGSPDWEVECSAGSVTPQPTETCNGLDDNCNGTTDENATGTGANNCHLEDQDNNGTFETYVGTPLDTGACDSGDTFCTGGVLACIGFTRPRTETCNGVDDDCDGPIDDNTQLAGTPCNVLSGTVGSTDTWNLLGACTAGTWQCPASAATAATTGLQCIGGVRPAATETCNNIDDDCDGEVDEDWVPTSGQPTPGSSCCPNDPSTTHVDVCNAAGAAFASCRPGTNQCAGGAVSCIQTNFTPSAEVCDVSAPQQDNDCDGNIDEGFLTTGVYRNIDNCGACGNDCRSGANQVDNAIMACVSGSCEIVTCDGGYFDDPNVAGEDCDLFCPAFAGDIELCDGEDNDCDGLTDEVSDLQGPVGATFCDQDGACAGAVPVCTDIGSGVKGWTCDKLPAATDTCDFNMASPGVSNVDDDCDGRIDEGLTIKAGFTAGATGIGVGKTCNGPGNGACRVSGVQVCDQSNDSRTTCMVGLGNLTEVTVNNAAQANEVCDGQDNDCDGIADEPCSCAAPNAACRTANTTSGILRCVVDDYAQLDADTWIYAFEASRPDAPVGGTSQGASVARACSATNRMPWTNVSHDDAVTACEAAGGRLCSRSEWRQACSCGGTGTTGSPLFYDYQWPSAGSCTSTSATALSQCNLNDSNGTIERGGQNASCYRTSMSTDMFDLSGNVKELTLAQDSAGFSCDPAATACEVDERIQVRGGASTNTAAGAACGYEKSFWPDDAPFYNVGFRCCFGPDPRAGECRQYVKTGLPASVPDNGTLNSDIVVTATGTVTRVRILNLRGDHTSDDMDDVDMFFVGPNNTMITLFNDRCDGDDDWAMKLQDGATGVADGSFCNGNTVGTSVSTAWAPTGSLSTYNGISDGGTWRLRVTDDDSGGGTLSLQSWTLEICTAIQ